MNMAAYIKEHEEDNIYEFLDDYEYNTKMEQRRFSDSVHPTVSPKDAAVFLKQSQEYTAKKEWCRVMIEKCITRLLDEINQSSAQKTITRDILEQALMPKVAPANFPHFTSEMLDFLEDFFWLVPKLDEDYEPKAKD